MGILGNILSNVNGPGLAQGIKGIVSAAKSGKQDNIIGASLGVFQQIQNAAKGAKG
ncbi:MAG: hypothetical protein AB7S38_16760 [Vulcanimicrobiota bacterium]